MSSPSYTMDTSCLINLFRKAHPFYNKRFVNLWKDIETLFNSGELVSHKEVFREIVENKDDLARWSKDNKFYFSDHTSAEMEFIKEIEKISPLFISKKVKSQDADPWLIAQASTNSLIIVTEEKLSSLDKQPQNYTIPDVCNRLKPRVRFMNLLELIDSKGWIY